MPPQLLGGPARLTCRLSSSLTNFSLSPCVDQKARHVNAVPQVYTTLNLQSHALPGPLCRKLCGSHAAGASGAGLQQQRPGSRTCVSSSRTRAATSGLGSLRSRSISARSASLACGRCNHLGSAPQICCALCPSALASLLRYGVQACTTASNPSQEVQNSCMGRHAQQPGPLLPPGARTACSRSVSAAIPPERSSNSLALAASTSSHFSSSPVSPQGRHPAV